MKENEKKIHYLKTIQPYFDAVWDGAKRFEVRLNDRDFKTGDEIYLQEYDPKSNKFSGKEVRGNISYVLEEYNAVASGFVVFGFGATQYIAKTSLQSPTTDK